MSAPQPTARPATDSELNRLLADLLGVQAKLATPVTRAAAAHDAYSASSARSEIGNPKSKIHQDLIPLSAPGPGEHYAFQVDLDACSGCKACVAACHALNGLDETEAWRDVGLLVSTDESAPWQQTITTACHHCSEPGCLEGCPVVAYEKDPITGIVRHLDDQCIGCSYCILKCPYDVPKFNARLGIVRKCDMCHQRLAVGEAPACAQACPTQAISIIKVPSSPVSAHPTPAIPPPPPSACACGGSCGCSNSSSTHTGHPSPITHHPAPFSAFLPAAPDPSYTQPTTRYISARGLPAHGRAADADDLRVQPAHWPLVAMLTCTQLAVGLLATAPLLPLPAATSPLPDTPPALGLLLSSPSGLLDHVNYWLTSSGILPLPELVTYYITSPREHAGLLIGLALLFAGLGASGLHLGKPLRAWRFFLGLRTSWLSREILVFSAFAPLALTLLLWPGSLPLRAAVIATGLLGVACSALIYIDTHRRAWALRPTGIRFCGTAIVAAAALVSPSAAAALLLAKLTLESTAAVGPGATARMHRGPLGRVFALRVGLGLAAGGAFLVAAPWLAFVLFATGELVERLLFFRSVDAPKMPGNPASA